MAASSDGRIILAGRTCGSWGQTNLGEGDSMGLMLQALSSQSPTAAPSPAAAPVGRSAARSAASPTIRHSAAPTPGSGRPLSTAAPTPGSGRPMSTTPPLRSTPIPSIAFLPTAAPPLRSTPIPSIDFLPTPASSDTTSIVAGVISAFAGIAVIVLGVFFRKRQIAKRNNASRQPPLSVVMEDGGNDQPTLQENPQPPPSEDAHVLSSATAAVAAVPADDDGGGGIEQPFPPALAGVVEPLAKPTAQGEEDAGGDGADGDGGGGGGDYGRGDGSSGCGEGVLLAEGGTMLPEHDGKDASGDDGSDRGRKALGTGSAEPSIHAGEDSSGGGGGGGDGGSGVALQGVYPKKASAENAFTVTTSTTNLSTGARDAFPPAYDGGGVAGPALVTEESKQTLHAVGTSSSTGRLASSVGLGTGRAVAESALALASSSQIPGVGEAAAAVSILVNVLMDNQDNKISTEASLRRCRSIVTMLERASKVLGKGGDTTEKAERAMMEDVHDAVFDLAELIKTYQSKNRLSQLLTSTLFRRRQDEMGAVVDRAILGLQLGLHVQVGTDVNAVKRDVSAFKEGMQLFQGSIDEAQGKSRAEARRARRQRKLDQIEIPEDHVTITNELLGKEGFGEVYLADYNGRNAAVKVLHINHDLGRRDENAILDRSAEGHLRKKREETQRKAFLIELGTMIRLRSPYTVNVYGAVTSAHDRLVLVMELLAGGDLRTLLKNAEQPLPVGQSRQIVGDICAGMAFLHSKKTVHGDLKSANVLLDGAGRAKIGDFGTSRWVQHTMSTGLATFTTKSSQNTQMSLAWSALEVLEADGSTYASDVYSFGIVVWEVLSRELPWVTVTHPKDIYIRVVLKNMRPVIPDDAPAQIANVARSCWAGEPGDRPTFSFILEGMKSNGWNE